MTPSDLNQVIAAAWPAVAIDAVSATPISQRRNADHWRVVFGERSMIIRVTKREESVRRISAALVALEGSGLAPNLIASYRDPAGTYLLAMGDLGDAAPSAGDIQANLVDFVDVLRMLHRHTRFGRATHEVGRNRDTDTSRRWAVEEWARLQRIAPGDPRVLVAEEWFRQISEPAPLDDAEVIMVAGHGDTHRLNWRLGPKPALIDWEEIRVWPLACELADFIVFGDLDVESVVHAYGAPRSYVAATLRETRSCAVSFYLYWLRTLIDGTDPRPHDLAAVAAVLDRLFDRT